MLRVTPVSFYSPMDFGFLSKCEISVHCIVFLFKVCCKWLCLQQLDTTLSLYFFNEALAPFSINCSNGKNVLNNLASSWLLQFSVTTFSCRSYIYFHLFSGRGAVGECGSRSGQISGWFVGEFHIVVSVCLGACSDLRRNSSLKMKVFIPRRVCSRC